MLVQNSFKFSVLALVRIIVMETEFISKTKKSICWIGLKFLKSFNNGFCIFSTIYFPFIHIQADN